MRKGRKMVSQIEALASHIPVTSLLFNKKLTVVCVTSFAA